MKVTRSLIVGSIAALVLLAAAGFGVASTQLASSTSNYQLKIDFAGGADGLVTGSDVLEAGTRIGTILTIEPAPSGSTALVTVSIGSGHWPLHRGLTADIRPKSLLGEKYVDLHDGPQSAPAYDANEPVIAPTNADPVELDQFINSLDPTTRTAVRVLLDDLGAGVAGRGNDLNTAIATGRANLEHLAVFGTTLDDRDPSLDQILVGLDGVLGKITTNDQLNQMSQLITNGQNVLNDIESVQGPFSRGFTDANVALADLNVALDGAVPSLRSTLSVAPALVSNLQLEADLLAELGATVTTQQNKSPNGECTSATPTPDQPISSLTGLTKCSPLWMLIRGLLGGPSITSGALEKAPGRSGFNPVFRVCVQGGSQQNQQAGACDSSPAPPISPGAGASGFLHSDSAMFAAFLGT